MIIKELYLENFGKFRNTSLMLKPGINLIYGDNETGKTTIHAFVRAMLFGLERKRGRGADKDDYSRYTPWDCPDYYQGMMRFEVDGVLYRIERNFYWNKKNVKIVREEDGRELTEEEGKTLLGGLYETSYANTVSIGQLGTKPGEELESVFKDYVINLTSTKNAELNMTRAITNLNQKKKELVAAGKPEKINELRAAYTACRAEKESLKKQNAELCRLLAEKKAQEEALTRQWNAEKKVEDAAKDELNLIQHDIAALREKINYVTQISDQMNEEYQKQLREIEEEKESFRQKYGFDTLEGAASFVLETKKKSVIAWPLFAITCLLIFVTITAFVLNLKPYMTVLSCICTVVALLALFLSARRRERKKNERLDFLDEGRIACLKMMEEEKQLDKKKETVIQKKAAISGQWEKLHEKEAGFQEKKEHLPFASKELLDEKERIETEGQKCRWELEQIEEKEENVDQEMAVLQKRLDILKANEEEIAAINQAISNIGQVADMIKGSFGVELNKRASEYIAFITKGKYRKITVDDRMNITVCDGNSMRNVEQLSKGTIEQMYLALRLAAADIIFSEDRKPVLLDDALVMYDNKRMAEALKCMADNVEQVLLFSCHTREKAVMDAKKIPYHMVRL